MTMPTNDSKTITSLPVASAYHRTPIRLLNTVLRGLNAIGLARVTLDKNLLIDDAKQQTGLDDFGDTRFLEPMQLLLKALEEEADLNPVGRFLTKQSILRLLKNRLYAQDLLNRHPEILERKIADPVVIVGLARSGTTRLHRMLAADDRFLHLQAWESVNPVPYPKSFIAKVDPRITAIEKGLKAVLYMSPQIAAVHPLGTFEVEEEVGLIQHGFSSQLFEIQAQIPSFAKWLMANEQTAAYEYMVVLMKIIAWYRNDPQDKPWVLKTPQHMQDLDALIHVFPNAKIICSHRDPVKAVGSACSMVWNSIVRDSDKINADWVGPEWLNKTEHMLKKTLSVRKDLVPASNQYDVLYADITANWQQAMQGIYDFIGMEFNTETKANMQRWLDSNAQHKHGAHQYQLEDFGINREMVEQRLQFYRQRFNIPYEIKNPHLADNATIKEESE